PPLGEASRAPRRARSRRELADPGDERLRPGHVAEREVIPDRREIDRRRGTADREERLDLGSEIEAARMLAKEERLLPEPVAREEKLRARGIPDREGEHPTQPLDDALAPLAICAQKDLGVAVARERVPRRLELGAQLPEVVDLAIEREREPRLLVAHGLRGAL